MIIFPDAHGNNEQKPLALPQEDSVHSSLDLTSSTNGPAPQSTMGGLNLSMLLPIPQGRTSDNLKPIIDFLGGQSQGKMSENLTSAGENLPIPKDSQPGVTRKMDSSAAQSQHGITPSILGRQQGTPSSLRQSLGAGVSGFNVASFSNNPTQNSFPLQNEQSSISPSTGYAAAAMGSTRPNNDNVKMASHGPKTIETSSKRPSPGNSAGKIGDLVKSFLESNFLGSLSDASYKNLMEQHFGSSIKPTTAPAAQTSPNKDLIANLVSELMLQSPKQGTTGNSIVNKEPTNPGNSQGSGVTNSLSSPTISIGNKVFSLDALSNALNNENGTEKHAQNISNDITGTLGTIKGSRKHSLRQKNREKIKQLNEKITTLATLSDALDALTVKLSPDEKPESDQNDQRVLPILGGTNIQGGRHKNHHTRHHRKKTQFNEDVEMLGSLLSGVETQLRSAKKPNYSAKDQKHSSYIERINGQKALNSADLEKLQSKINKAIEMAESMERQHDAKETKLSWLPLLVSRTVAKEEGAHAREEVTTVHANHSNPQGSVSVKNSGIHSLQEILTRLIDNALQKGTLNELVQRWNRSGSPLAEIAQNISIFLQGSSALKVPLTNGENGTTVNASVARRPVSTVKSSLTSQILKGIPGFNKTSPIDKHLFIKAVNSILGVLARRQDFHRSNSTNQSLYVTTDTLTDIKGILLGGRINKIVPQEDSISILGSKIMEKATKDKGNNSQFEVSSPKQENLKLQNKSRDRKNMTVDLKPFHDDHGKHPEKEKLVFSNYDAKNMSKSIRNNTLMEIMDSISGTGGQNPLPQSNKPGDKHSKVKPHLSDLLSVITASLLDIQDADEDSSSHNKKTKFRYDESGNERLLHHLPNDHKLSDYSMADAVLEAPNDHTVKKNSTSNHTDHLPSSASSSIPTLLQNKTSKLKPKSPTYKEKHDFDLDNQTVTLTLETLDDTPGPLSHTNKQSKEQTGFRSNKVPHYFNIQSAKTLGKINSTSSKNTALSEFIATTKKPDLPSNGDGKLMTISPSSEIGQDSQTETNLPLGSQMNAIGRIAGTDDEPSMTPTDLSAASAGFSNKLASEGVQTKSFEDKILPVASDLSSERDNKMGGETKTFVAKAASPTTGIETPTKATPERELPTASEVREIASSIKALLKILNSYSKKLKLEDNEDNSHTGLLPTRSRTAERVANNEERTKPEEDTKYKQADGNNVIADALHANHHQQETLGYLMEPPKPSLTDQKVNNNNPYANFPQSSPLKPGYVDSGGFENIQEQPITHAAVNSYNWNFQPAQVHAQSPLDANPTKSSLQPQLGAESWNPGNEVSRVTEELKDFNLPSIEDDPTVRAVQNLVAEENVFESQKRKAIQKHEQQVSGVNGHLQKPRKFGMFGRNTIPKSKVKGHHRNESHMVHEKKVTISGKQKIERKPNERGRERNKIPRITAKNQTLSHQQKLAIRKSRPTLKGNTTQYGTRHEESHKHRMPGSGGKKTQLVSSRNHIPGSRNRSRLNKSVNLLIHKDSDSKTKASVNKGLRLTQAKATLKGPVKAVKISKQTNSGAGLSEKGRRHDASSKTEDINEMRKGSQTIKSTNYVMHLKNETEISTAVYKHKIVV